MSVNHIAFALSKLCPAETLADLLACLVSCDADERLTDDEAIAGETLFDALVDIVPESTVWMAQER